ncbi:MAG: Uma2 family endonuclease, partial [Pirellulaceae bacterium]
MASNPRQSPITADLTPGEPAWGVALLFPPQGSWTETDYLELDAGRIVEFDKGCVEVHDMPTKAHQRIVQFLFGLLNHFVLTAGLGEVFLALLPVRLWAEKFREPDLLFLRSGRGEFRGYPDGADLVVEVLSEGEVNRRRDRETKREEYCRAGIDEYWIVDPNLSTIT